MWFRQLTFYRLRQPDAPKSEQLSATLEKHTFRPCMGLDWFSEGWTPPADHLDAPVYAVRGHLMIALRREDKVLPSSVIRDFVELKITEIEEKELRKVGHKEKLTLKEQVTDDLLPRAFVRSSRINAYLDPHRGWLMIDSATTSKAEGVVSKLRDALPPFPVSLPRTKLSPLSTMTDWLANGAAPSGFELDADCELKDNDEHGAVVRCVRIDLTADEIRQHIITGKQVTRIGLIWQDKIRFQLTDTLQLKRIQFLDLLQDEAGQADDDKESLFEASFTLMSEALGELVDSLIVALGGLEEEPSKSALSNYPAEAKNVDALPWD